MVKPLAFVLVVLALGPSNWKVGCEDTKRSLTHLDYYTIRDMRRSVALMPQKGAMLPPDSASVPIQGREWGEGKVWSIEERDAFAARFTLPPPAGGEQAAIQRGEAKFMRTCSPCHGKSMAGDGAVAAQFMPPPDLMGAQVRARKDGYIYSYIRFGGAVMPSYGAAVTAAEAYDLIHYLRHMQQTTPR
jgi:mono/diheme cytochrome c family protein